MRVQADGKFFALAGRRFRFCAAQIGSAEISALANAGFTVAYLAASAQRSAMEASACGMQVLLACPDPDWSMLRGASGRQQRRILRECSGALRGAVRAAHRPSLFGVAVGHALDEATADHIGRPALRRLVADLAAAAHDEDADVLVTWIDPSPTQGGCPGEIDFLTVALSPAPIAQLRTQVDNCHRAVGDRPLVVMGTGLDELPEAVAATTDVCLERGVAGLIYDGRTGTRAAGSVCRRSIRDLNVSWPSISVVICAYNAASTLEECLRHSDNLDYPNLEVMVVDDGSDDDTAAIASRHQRVRVIQLDHVGLAAARNAGARAATGELIAYLDADAYPPPEWPWYLALAVHGADVAGCGGPNVPPRDDPLGAFIVAKSPGGPLPQIRKDGLASHLPGCNMAFWKTALDALDGFDPVLWSAEDVEFEWRLLRSGRRMAYHPAALVWHHRRPGTLSYLRQQRNYGRGQALTEFRYPDRFPLRRRSRQLARAVLARGPGGTNELSAVEYRSLRWEQHGRLDILHQWGIPAAVLLLLTAPFGLMNSWLVAPALVGVAFVASLFWIDAAIAVPPRPALGKTLRFRLLVATHHVLRPLAYHWGKSTEAMALRRRPPSWAPPPPTPAPTPT